tara:strand:+ start:1287 stop:1835 length:549 start_codon:yes stop_codon:yes gene_type:complete
MSTRKYNNVQFNDEFVSFIDGELNEKFKKFWGVKYKDKTDGCVRTLNGKIIAFYFYVDTNSNKQSILKFNFRSTKKGDEFQFDSIYVNKDLKGINQYQEYRYDENNNLIAVYNFGDDKAPFFCEQFKEDEHVKNYTHSFKPKLANNSLVKFSLLYLNKNLHKTKVDYFHVQDNKKEIYWFIR